MPYADKAKESEYQRRYRESHKESRKAYAAAWYAEHPYSSLTHDQRAERYAVKVRMQELDPERRRKERRRHYERHAEERRAASRATPPEVRKHRQLKTKYGLTLDEFNVMFDKQSGLCAICAKPMTRPNVDHDHATSAVRGLLCTPCNTALGSFNDDPELLLKAASYLEEHSAT